MLKARGGVDRVIRSIKIKKDKLNYHWHLFVFQFLCNSRLSLILTTFFFWKSRISNSFPSISRLPSLSTSNSLVKWYFVLNIDCFISLSWQTSFLFKLFTASQTFLWKFVGCENKFTKKAFNILGAGEIFHIRSIIEIIHFFILFIQQITSKLYFWRVFKVIGLCNNYAKKYTFNGIY